MPKGTPLTRKCPRCKRGAWRKPRAVLGVQRTGDVEARITRGSHKGYGSGRTFWGHRGEMLCLDCNHRWFSTHPSSGAIRCSRDDCPGPWTHGAKAQPKARRLAAIAAWINANLSELEAVVEEGYSNTDRKIGRLRWPGKGRRGTRIIVRRKRDRTVMLDHNAAEVYRKNAEVEAWLTKYIEARSKR